MLKYLDMVPTWVWETLIVLVLVLMIFFNGKIQYWRGEHSVRVADTKVVTVVKKETGAVTVKIVKEYVPVIKTIQLAGKTIVKKVPIYVTQKDNNAALINNGFVSLWNSANKMQLPDSSEADNEGRSQVVLSDIAAEHSKEATICTETEQQRDALKSWILGQEAVYNK